ncbi:hypothetical protein GCM10010112_13350 [Actinoplanes lobatus]|uniref:Uncharacterized protein n=1 Tax=Actinoplanes lobatus TaxID=113568 RepID=A0A7W7HM95_9ACTN|nr:hypothetical protein [Actinoplanes lobatus]MBB4753171.1 hypothetical protein [Actinoplanes lobatus]GGN58981.1 hypothetical protein GCM10010112_13350 [Actinoplanes lobatus]GIE42968.1 hypothetical protein Alo02nite_58660 [Actinoplanes lobatus]
MPPSEPARRHRPLATALVIGFFLLAGGGYLMLLRADQRKPPPARPPASFGVALTADTSPNQVQSDIGASFYAYWFDSPTSRASLSLYLKTVSGEAESPTGGAYFLLPTEVELKSVDLTLWEDQTADAAEVNQQGHGEAVTPRTAVDGRLLRVSFPDHWARLEIELDLAIDPTIYSRPSRIAEQAISVEFGSLDALAAAADVRPLPQFASGEPAQKLAVDLDYTLDPVETEFESFPQPTEVRHRSASIPSQPGSGSPTSSRCTTPSPYRTPRTCTTAAPRYASNWAACGCATPWP